MQNIIYRSISFTLFYLLHRHITLGPKLVCYLQLVILVLLSRHMKKTWRREAYKSKLQREHVFQLSYAKLPTQTCYVSKVQTFV
jgi:hypothetical protein